MIGEKKFDPACVEAFLSRWDEVVGIAAGQAVTPLRKSEAALAPSASGATGGRPDLDRMGEAAAAV
jgi:putative two-component system response regulator